MDNKKKGIYVAQAPEARELQRYQQVNAEKKRSEDPKSASTEPRLGGGLAVLRPETTAGCGSAGTGTFAASAHDYQ